MLIIYYISKSIVLLNYWFSFSKGSKFGPVPTNFTMNNVTCAGDETELRHCGSVPGHNCTENDGAGVICRGEYPVV